MRHSHAPHLCPFLLPPEPPKTTAHLFHPAIEALVARLLQLLVLHLQRTSFLAGSAIASFSNNDKGMLHLKTFKPCPAL